MQYPLPPPTSQIGDTFEEVKEEMKAAMDRLAKNTRKTGDNYIPGMPKISQIGMMSPEEVFNNLSILETSIYKG